MSTDCPRFDLILLLLDPNGRVAALNPEDPCVLLGLAGDTQCPWVTPVGPHVPVGQNRRSGKKKMLESVAMTLPVVAVGESVAVALASAIGGCRSDGGSNVPSDLISPTNGELVWFVDPNAAASIS